MDESKMACLQDPLEQLQLESLVAVGGKKPDDVEKILVSIFKRQAIEGNLEHSQNQLLFLTKKSSFSQGVTISRSVLVSSLERLVMRNVVHRRVENGSGRYALRVFTEAARASWD